MRTYQVLKIAALAALITLATALPTLAANNVLTAQEKKQGWRLLFDGKSLKGWGATGRMEGWKVEDGAIVCLASGGGYLYTQEQFGDFTLSLDFKFEPHANSGVFLRWSDLNDPVNTGIEIQILDSYGRQRMDKHDCGAIYDIIAPSRNMCKPAGEWNRLVVTCKGPMITVRLNGPVVAQMNMDLWTQPGRNPDGTPNKFRYAYKDMARVGHIGFQDHGYRVWFRNIKILPLGGAKARVGALSSAAELFPVVR